MEVLYADCAGLDVRKHTVVACARRAIAGKAAREVRTFKTTAGGLLALSEWLCSQGIAHIAMEAAGVCRKPAWNILSGGDFTLTLANAAHVKNVPGRKTGVNDATWLADLLVHGPIRARWVPDAQTQEQRGLPRTRKQPARERTSHVQRLWKTPEEAGIALDSAISGVIGARGRATIGASIAGETGPAKPARLASSRIKAAPQTPAGALRGRVTGHHRFLLRLHLEQTGALDRAIAVIDKEAGVNPRSSPFALT
jgi:transposase